MLVDPGAVMTCLPMLAPADFYLPSNQMICQAIFDLARDDVAADVVTLADRLRQRKELDKVGGEVALSDLWNETVTAAAVEHHAKIVIEKAQLRHMLQIARAIETNVSEGKSAAELMGQTEKAVLDVGRSYDQSEYESVGDIMPRAMEAIDARMSRKTEIQGIATGWHEIDRATLGIQRGDFTVLAARPSIGKTAFGLGLAVNAARAGQRVLFVSLEMQKLSLMDRLLAMVARVDGLKIRSGMLTSQEQYQVAKASEEIAGWEILIDEGTGQTAMEVRAKARRQMIEKPFDMLMIDYLTLLDTPLGPNETRAKGIGTACRILQNMAKELDIAAVSLAQLARPAKGMEKRRPTLVNLKESGEIEEAADLIMFLHRPDHGTPKDDGLTEVLIPKNRNGPTGFANLKFVKEEIRFENLGGQTEMPT